jgi:hypothetical protein
LLRQLIKFDRKYNNYRLRETANGYIKYLIGRASQKTELT